MGPRPPPLAPGTTPLHTSTLLYGWLHTILTRSQRFSAAARTNLSGPNMRTRLGFEPLRLSEGDMKEEVTRRT